MGAAFVINFVEIGLKASPDGGTTEREVFQVLGWRKTSSTGGKPNLIVDQFDEYEVDMIPAVPLGEEI
jgi:hypothetical protein